jgi:transposase InsO family protein
MSNINKTNFPSIDLDMEEVGTPVEGVVQGDEAVTSSTKNVTEVEVLINLEKEISLVLKAMATNQAENLEFALDTSEEAVAKRAKIDQDRAIISAKLVSLYDQRSVLLNTRKVFVPKNIPAFQLKDDLDAMSTNVTYDTVDTFLSNFEMVIVHQHNLKINDHWEACYISAIQHSLDKATWYQHTLMGKMASWSRAKSMIHEKYRGSVSHTNYVQQLWAMKATRSEDPLVFVERFRALLVQTGFEDTAMQGTMLLNALQDAYPQVASQIRVAFNAAVVATAPGNPEPVCNVRYVAKAASMLFQHEFWSHHGQKKNGSGNGSSASKWASKTFKKSRVNKSEQDKVERGLCFKGCGEKWSPNHKCGKKAEKRKARKMKMKQKRSAAIESAAVEMEARIRKQVEEEFAAKEAARLSELASLTEEDLLTCKSHKRKTQCDNPNANMSSIIVPLTIENHRLFALVDTGATFSSICYSFFINTSWILNKKQGSIILASTGQVDRVGVTNNLSLTYNGKNYEHVFEIMKYHPDEKYQCIIGTDLFSKLGMFITGLATSFEKRNYFEVTDPVEYDTPVPDKSPAGTAEEQKIFHEQIKHSMVRNQNISTKSFCTVPESIITLDTPPGKTCYRRQYPLPDRVMPIVDKVVAEWLHDGTIVKARVNCEWNSPLLLVGKKDENGNKTKQRPCLDPRHINNLLPEDKYPIPLIRDVFATMKNAKVFSTLDLKTAFHRFMIHPKDQHKTTFTHKGIQYMFVGAPFGLKPLSSKYQRVTAMLLQDMEFATSFIDDIVVYSNNMTEHAQHVQMVIEKLTSVNLILNPEKCHFANRSVHLLGFCVSEKGLSLDPRKVTNVQDWPVPKTGNDIEKFLGIVNYFRDNIPKISQLMAPLDRLRKAPTLKNKWTSLEQTAFMKLKRILTIAPIIQYPIENEKMYISTDASNTAVAGCLFQLIDQKVRYLGFFARALTASEKFYNTTRKELLALVFSLLKFHKFIWGNHIVIFSDHRALVYVNSQKQANSMIVNWLDIILQYDFTVAHIPGMDNILPDALSRLFPVEKSLEGYDKEEEDAKEKRKRFKASKLDTIVNKYEDCVVPPGSERKKLLKMYHRSTSLQTRLHLLQPEENKMEIVNNNARRKNILQRQHAFGHFGALAMERAIHADGLHWPNLRQDVLDIVKRCDSCMKFNIAKKGYNPLNPITATMPASHWSLDMGGPFKITSRGNKFILIMVDICTRYTIARAVPDKKATTIGEALMEIFCTFGFPTVLQSDSGTEFLNAIIKKITDANRISHRTTSFYHPRANGAAENRVKVVKDTLLKELDARAEEGIEWDCILPTVQLAINAQPVKLTQSAPFSLMFARKLNTFPDYAHTGSNDTTGRSIREGEKEMSKRIYDMANIVLPAIAEKTKDARDKAKKKFDKKHNLVKFKVGSLVALYNNKRETKDEPRYTGPFRVIGQNKGGAYILETPSDRIRVKGKFPPSSLKSVLDNPFLLENWKLEVDKIIDVRGPPSKFEYLVRYKDLGEEDDSWEPKEAFKTHEHIQRFWNQRRKQQFKEVSQTKASNQAESSKQAQANTQ